MVTEGKLFIELLQHPRSIDTGQINLINRLINEFPYFQPAHLLYTLYLKEHNLFYQDALQHTAARTTDRRQLYEIIHLEEKETSEQNNVTKKKEKTSTNVKITTENEPDIEVFIPADTTSISESKEPEEEKIEETENTNAGKQPEKLTYLDWLKQLKRIQPEKNKDIFDAIDKFLKEKPKIIPKKDYTVKTPDIVEKSVAEKQTLMTETLADLYVKQKKYDKAIQAFRILSLKYPKKSSYFANRIKEIKKLK
jgi:hypothetical protein